MGDKEGIDVWHRINDLFNWLPLAANIENKILCMHGGIGRCISTIAQIAELQRPITMETGGQVQPGPGSVQSKARLACHPLYMVLLGVIRVTPLPHPPPRPC